MKRALMLAALCLWAAAAVGQTVQKSQEEIQKRQREIQERQRQIQEKQRQIQLAMRKGVVVMPLVKYPDDWILPHSGTDRSLPEELQKRPWYERLDCVRVGPGQLVVAAEPVEKYSVYSIQDTGRETWVTWALPVGWDRQWHAYNKGCVVVDEATGDRYFPRRIENGLPFDKIWDIQGYDGNTVLFTVVYPRLKYGVKRIRFTDAWPIKTELPLNRTPRRDIVVEDVQNLIQQAAKKGKDIY